MKWLSKQITKRDVQIVLGVLWILDGALQLQRAMFTSDFANQVIAPAAQGQPGFVRWATDMTVRVILISPAQINALFAIAQLAIGILMLWKQTVRWGLLGSIAWGLGVWYAGEGLGGLFSGHAMILNGAPGAALLYAIIALGVWPTKDEDSAKAPAAWLAVAWAVLWVGGAIYQLLPGQNSIANLTDVVSGVASDAPSSLAWLANRALDSLNAIGHTAGSGFWFIVLLALVQATVGLGGLAIGVTRRLAIGVGALLSLVFWTVGQSLGAYYSGLATDPNSAPLFILLGLAVLESGPLWTKAAKPPVTPPSKKALKVSA
ncbi:MAG TPA: hypothetical protein VNG90_00855 [Candidatus Acidoferrum sp.]|nr:hypothetical protein [Candidatus Acidoferrum sp.]